MLILKNSRYEIVIKDDVTYTPGSVDNNPSYGIEYVLGDQNCRPSSQHSVTVKSGERVLQSCILLSDGGPSRVHEHSALLYGDSCVVAVGPFLCSLQIPSLQLEWQTEVDTGTCFGVYYSAKHDCLISHGELEIARVERGGKLCWQASGADIFSNGFTLHDNHIEAVDFNGWHYRISIDTGAICTTSGV